MVPDPDIFDAEWLSEIVDVICTQQEDVPSTPSEQAALRRQMIGDEVEWARKHLGPDVAADMERSMFARFDRVTPAEQED